jgi:hypothetical protein
VVTPDGLGGHLQRRADDGVNAIQRGGHFGRIDLDGRRFGAVEPGCQLAYGLVTAAPNIVENGPYGGQGLAFGIRTSQVGPWQGGPQVRSRTGQIPSKIESSEHALTLPAAARGLGWGFRPESARLACMDESGSNDARVDAELSSLASQLEALTRRIEDLAAFSDTSADEEARDRSGLHEVERHLRGALRELARSRRA